jgi:membrane protein
MYFRRALAWLVPPTRGMESLKAKLADFQRSRVGLFIKKVLDDQAPNLASLLAWGTLSTMLPLLLGVLSVAGLILRDPQRLDDVYNTVLVLVPSDAAGPISSALDGVRHESAAPAGVIAIILLLFNGSSFFANMASVFDQAYHVQSRNFIMQRLVALAMLIIMTALVIVSTLAAGIGSIVGNVPIGLPIGPVLARVVGWSVSVVSVFVLFVLIYKILPNARQTWRDVIPGTALATLLLLVISQVFPVYVSLFPPNHAYALFGVFLLLTFYLYVLGLVFVLGAELNAFRQAPSASLALAEATTAAQPGTAGYNRQTGHVRAEATGVAPAMQGGGALGTPVRSTTSQLAEQDGCAEPQPPQPAQRSSLTGRILGFIGLIVAALLLRRWTATTTDEHAAT